MTQDDIKAPRNIAYLSNTLPGKNFACRATVVAIIKGNGKHHEHFQALFYVIIVIQKQSQTTNFVNIWFPVIPLIPAEYIRDKLWKAGCV